MYNITIWKIPVPKKKRLVEPVFAMLINFHILTDILARITLNHRQIPVEMDQSTKVAMPTLNGAFFGQNCYQGWRFWICFFLRLWLYNFIMTVQYYNGRLRLYWGYNAFHGRLDCLSFWYVIEWAVLKWTIWNIPAW